ncbi:pseudouridine synthase [Clostridium caseinilyticum]|uniref:pseudouridine synthase n=1 Tax=Clostridium caseinilyticum TaxID=3350403 RepID=UPI0039080286
MNKRINIMYFSATDTTKKVVYGIAEKLSEDFKVKEKINSIDFTLPKVREKVMDFSKEDIVVVGVPVYAGRVPNVLLKYLKTIISNDALAIAVVVYGNRNYDDALIELKDILELDGFKVVAGTAFIGEHSFSNTLAKNRPDEKDMDTSGLIILTNDGEIYNKIIHPKFEKIKTYKAKVKGSVKKECIDLFNKGVDIGDYITAPAILKIMKNNKYTSEIIIKIHEGKNRQVRRMCSAINHPVINLDRISIGIISKGNLKLGEWRYLTKEEIDYIIKK